MTLARTLLQSSPLPGAPTGSGAHAFSLLAATVQAAWAEGRAFLESVFDCAPYLCRLAQRRSDLLLALAETTPEEVFESLLEAVERCGSGAKDTGDLDHALRGLKADMHLLVALADLAREWQCDETTSAVTRFADAAVAAVLHAHVRFAAEQGRCHPPADPANPLPGLFVFALGKMGTGELNYSSDIDLVIFFDPESLDLPETEEPRKRLPRLVQAMMRSLSDVTDEGYVFRTDLRLRPDPGATPVALSSDAALNYYEMLGQTWERAAWIKARCCAGDATAAAHYLDQMQAFIWRRTLDYAAIDDIRGLARQIQTVGRRARIDPAGHDLKLGRGGIREIEFFAQIPQLVFGGRDRDLRTRATLKTLTALASKGILDRDDADELAADYRTLRDWEHRVQMRQDEASQTLPARDEDRLALARLAGFEGLADFDADVESVLRRVHAHFSDQFQGDAPLASQAGSLVLTGVEPTPDTVTTLSDLGFSQPDIVWKRLNAWAAGRARAVRSSRARTLFAQIAPRLVDTMSATGEPDAAFDRFSAFFENLPFGVQPLSLLMNEPELAADVIRIITMAPRLASALARRPELLDAMLDKRFTVPVSEDKPGVFAQRLAAETGQGRDFESAMNIARRLVHEEQLRIGAQILSGRADAHAAGAAFSELADASIEAMARAAERETARRHGPAPAEYAVLGMGKLGGRELAADSDIDLMIVYDADIMAQTWFMRFAQRLVSALSAPTAEGELYEVDMQLRPSGKSGPVAVQLGRFASYYQSEAWTWELLALTRARPVAGSGRVGSALSDAAAAALSLDRDREAVLEDARAMRARLLAAKPARSDWDLKARRGGLQDIEFIVQTLILLHARDHDVIRASTQAGISALAQAGILADEDAQTLSASLRVDLGLLQLLRAAHGSGFNADIASDGFAALVSKACGVNNLSAVRRALEQRSDQVRMVYEKYMRKT